MEREQFIELLKNGPESEEIQEMIVFRETSGCYVKFGLDEKRYGEALVSVDLLSSSLTIYGFLKGKEVVKEEITETFGEKWKELAEKTYRSHHSGLRG